MEYFTRLRRFWFPDFNAFVWLLLALPGLYFFQTVVHEGTHGVVARHNNGDFPKVAPFPHLAQTKIGNKVIIGGFLNGVTIPDKPVTVTERTDCDPKVGPVTYQRLAGWIGWPQVVALLLTIIFAALFVFVPIKNPLIAFLLRAWYLGACIDFLFNSAKILVGICTDTQDWARVMIRGDHSAGMFWFITLLLWLLVFSHFVWVWWSRWGQEELEERGYWDYRWIGLLLGVLSTVAFIWSLALGDDHIDKKTIFFIFPLIVQFFAAFFHLSYFVKTFFLNDEETASS